MEERRFAVLDVADGNMQDRPFFASLVQQMEGGGYEAFLHDLLFTVDADGPNVSIVPATMALFEQKVASLTPEQSWWLDILEKGILPGDYRGVGEAQKERVYGSYIFAASRVGTRHRSFQTIIGIFLKRTVPGLADFQRHPSKDAESKKAFWLFPPLAVCREHFARLTRRDSPWGEPFEWTADASSEDAGPDDDDAELDASDDGI